MASSKETRDQVFFPKHPPPEPVERSLRRVLECSIFSKITLEGRENLEEVRRLSGEAKPVVLTPNHLSHLDHPFLYLTFHKYGFSDLWEKIVFVGRKSLYRELYFRPFLSFVDILGVTSPREMDFLNEEEKKKARQENRETLKTAWRKLQEGKILVVYPEGQRSRSGALIRGAKEVASFWHLLGAFVVPLAISGTEKVLPPNFLNKRILPQFTAPLSLVVGKPIAEEFLRQQAQRDKQAEVDLVGEAIACLLPPQYRGVYYK